jgi:lipid A ethanolaminephosphotransferase
MCNLGVYIDSDMIRNTFETNVREALDFLTFSGFLWVLTTGIIPAVLVIFAKIQYKSFLKEFLKRIACIVAMIVIGVGFFPLVYKQYVSFMRNNREIRKLLNTFNYSYSTFRYFQKQTLANREFKKLDENAIITPSKYKRLTILMFIVGETARAKNFSLYGYERETNPLLKRQNIVAFYDAESCGTATALSVPCMFSHLQRTDFDVVDAKYTENLIDIIKTAGYDVLWRENDDGCKGVCDRALVENMVKINNSKYCNGEYCLDEVLLDGLDEKLKNIQDNTVIFLHTMGSHGPTYYNRYPDEFKKFGPTCDTKDIQTCEREQIINTYDNTILYTDHIISSVIDILKKYPQYKSGLIYASDHGESLGENNVYLHGFPYKIAPKEQKHIPMIFWMNDTMKGLDYIDYDCLIEKAKTESYTHDNLFHSVISLLRIKTHLYNQKFDIFKNCRTEKHAVVTSPKFYSNKTF